jgi:hypothetical protein
MRSSIAFIPHHILLDWNELVKKYEIGMACRVHGRDEGFL